MKFLNRLLDSLKPFGMASSLFLALSFGVAALVAFSRGPEGFDLSVLSASLLLGGAWMAVAGVVGFLFGVPRTMQSASPADAPAGYATNTNLEQISDWLTKILVGVGLTQISTLPDQLYQLSVFIGAGTGDTDTARSIALGSFLYFSAVGFVYAYLWARIYLLRVLIESDRDSLAKKIAAMDQRQEADAKALAVIARHLDDGTALTPARNQEILDAVKGASSPVRARIYYDAQQRRRATWSSAATKNAMERTIPIFEALIAADTEGRYHANHAQLAYALKDARRPDLKRALDELNRAIELRGPDITEEWMALYEFNRAECLIQLDADFRSGQPTTQGREAISKDLRVLGRVRPALLQEEPLAAWIAKNPGAV